MKRCTILCALAALTSLCACATLDELAGNARLENGPVYPQSLGQSGMLDIQVFRRETVLVLTNTTSESFPHGGRIWVNAQFSMPFEKFEIGETLSVDLRDFVNEFGERFRAGGFFATERPDRVVLVQIEHSEQIIGLVVVEDEAR